MAFNPRHQAYDFDGKPGVSPLAQAVLDDVSKSKATGPISQAGVLSTCALTSATLLLLGAVSKFAKAGTLDRRKTPAFESQALPPGSFDASAARKLLTRILGVGLPFYAASKLGGTRVSLFILLALAVGIIEPDKTTAELLNKKRWKRILSDQRWTMAAVIIQCAADFVRSTSTSIMHSILPGYLALSASLLFLPLPLASNHPQRPAVTSSNPRQARLASRGASPRRGKSQPNESAFDFSPLVCNAGEVNLTLLAGGATAALTMLLYLWTIPIKSAFPVAHFLYGLLSAGTMASSLLVSQPKSIQLGKGLGLGLGPIISYLLWSFLHHESWTSIAYQVLFIGVSLVAFIFDTHLSFSTSSHESNHHHHQSTELHGHHGPQSRLTTILLQRSQRWPLLHSILVEKDSRRIFYFML